MTTLAPPCRLAERSPRAAGNTLNALPAPARPEPFADLFKSVTLLASEKGQQTGLERFREAVLGLHSASTQTLILRLATASDALLTWAIHLELDRRAVPPCLRWPANTSSTQAEFITWLADIHWFAKRHPLHKAQSKGWRDLLAQAPATAKWHGHACRQYGHAEMRRGQRSLSHWCAHGLALTDAQRRDLMTLPTKQMHASRSAIVGEPFARLEQALLDHAVAHPDRSGEHEPDAIATRRALMFRVYVLAGGSATTAARYWALLTGEQVSRQAIAKQIDAVEAIAGS